MRLGITGYSAQKFDEVEARQILEALIDNPEVTEVVSGYTNLGIPAIAYSIAKRLGKTTVGVACLKAETYECFDCDKVSIVGENWGDESEAFLFRCDRLVRIGGGAQAHREVAMARAINMRVFEYELPAIVAG